MRLLHNFVKFISHILILALLILVCVLSVVSYNNNYNLVCEKINSQEAKTSLSCTVTSFPKELNGKLYFDAKIKSSDKDYLIGKSVYVILGNCKNIVSKGDELKFECEISVAEGKMNEGAFDYRDHLKSKDIVAVASETKILSHKISSSHVKKIYEIRKDFIENAEKYIYTNGLITAVITGDRTYIQEDTEDHLKKSGVYHIVAISGLHLNLFIIAISELIEKAKGKRTKKAILAFILCSLTGIFVMIFTGFGMSVIRAFIMMLILNASHIIPRENNSKVSLLLTGFFVITFMPFTVWSVSWWLSFLSTFGVIISVDIVKFLKEKYTLPSGLTGFIGQTFVASVLTSLFTLPVTSYVFGYVPLYSWIANALILPVMSFFMALGVVFAFVSSFDIEFISLFLGFVLTGLSEYISFVVKTISLLPISTITTYADTFPKVAVSIVFLISLIPIVKGSSFKKITAYLIVLCVATGSFLVYNYNDANKLKITFAYSGQGDTSLIQVNGYNIMIDSGTLDLSDSTPVSIEAMLRAKNIKKLDALIITHYHKDHTNIAIDLLSEVKVENLLLPKYYNINETECEQTKENLITNAVQNGVKIEYVHSGCCLDIGKDARLEFISPTNDMFEDSNNMSLVSRLTYGETKVIFFGDSEEDAFERLKNLDLECDIFKLAHHGGYSDLSREIIENTNAKIAVASCGKNNMYSHPNEKILKILNECGIDIYRTDKDGAVTVIADKYKNFKTETVR